MSDAKLSVAVVSFIFLFCSLDSEIEFKKIPFSTFFLLRTFYIFQVSYYCNSVTFDTLN